MKKLLFALGVAVAVAGCAHITVTKSDSNGNKVEAKATSLFSNSAIKGLIVDGSTKTTTNLLKVTGATTEPNPDSITASGEALGTLIGTAAKTAIK